MTRKRNVDCYCDIHHQQQEKCKLEHDRDNAFSEKILNLDITLCGEAHTGMSWCSSTEGTLGTPIKPQAYVS